MHLEQPVDLSRTLVGAALDSIPATSPERWPLIRTGEREPIHKFVRWLIFHRDGKRCLSCGIGLTIQTARLDHIIPWSAGGSDRSENLRLLCHPCNTTCSNFRGDLDTWGARRTPVCWGCASCYHIDNEGYELCDPLPVEPDMIAAYCGFCGIVSRARPEETW